VFECNIKCPNSCARVRRCLSPDEFLFINIIGCPVFDKIVLPSILSVSKSICTIIIPLSSIIFDKLSIGPLPTLQ